MTETAANDMGASMDARLIGQTLGESYRVLRRIGAGGMGQVYEAEHTLLGRHFALKVLDTAQLTRRDAVSRFFAEARAASQIEHPHIVDVVHFVTDGPFMVLVMELLRGESLAERLTRGPLPVRDAVEVLSQVCEALAASHAAGILHRDLKPANVFLCERAQGVHAKVLDFGIAKLKPGYASGAEGLSAGVTTTGQLLGTPRYLSPEQARGALEIDERSDVYSAGVMLFEMLAGRPPFEGHNAFQLIWKHGNEPAPALSSCAPGVSPQLDALLARALDKDPAARFPSMLALRDALHAALPGVLVGAIDADPHTRAATAPREPTRRRWGGLAWAAVALSLALGALLAVSVEGRSTSEPSPRTPSQAAGVAEGSHAAAPEPLALTAPATPIQRPLSSATARAPAALSIPLRVAPAHARVTIDGGEPQAVSGALELPAGQELQLAFTAPGYATEVRTLTPRPGDRVDVVLTRRRGRGTPSAGSPIKSHF